MEEISAAYQGDRLAHYLAGQADRERGDPVCEEIWKNMLWHKSKRRVIGKTILDIGCGDGHMACAIADLGAGRVVGIDPSEAMLATAQVRAASRENVFFVLGKGEMLPMPDASCDGIFSRFALQHADDLGMACSEAYRVLKKGGFFTGSLPTVDLFAAENPEVRQLEGTLMPWRLQGAGNALVHNKIITNESAHGVFENAGFLGLRSNVRIMDNSLGYLDPEYPWGRHLRTTQFVFDVWK